MMQAVRDKVQCSRCGCIALPDATRCPRCGALYSSRPKETVSVIDCISRPMIENEDTRMVRAYYQFTCRQHGRIHVKATVIGSAIKCPFRP